ncbi:MAG: hypothetical protein P8178_07360 [Candidatus Thiodiazotropha sp.]
MAQAALVKGWSRWHGHITGRANTADIVSIIANGLFVGCFGGCVVDAGESVQTDRSSAGEIKPTLFRIWLLSPNSVGYGQVYEAKRVISGVTCGVALFVT